MKYSIFLLSILLSWISCSQHQELAKNATDKQKIIYDVIYLSLTDRRMPAYSDLKGEKTVYLYNRYINFINSAPTDEKPLIDESDIPKVVKGHPVKLMSEQDLIQLANETGMFEFMLSMGNIKIKGDSASIAIDGEYKSPAIKRMHQMSGGGGLITYLKENGVWVFHGFTQQWIE